MHHWGAATGARASPALGTDRALGRDRALPCPQRWGAPFRNSGRDASGGRHYRPRRPPLARRVPGNGEPRAADAAGGTPGLPGDALRVLPDEAEDRRPRRFGSVALEQARRITLLVDDLVDVGRLESGELGIKAEPVDLVPLVTRAVETAEPLAKSQTIRLDAEPGPIRVEGDPPPRASGPEPAAGKRVRSSGRGAAGGAP